MTIINRVKITTNIDKAIHERFDKLAEQTNLQKSKLYDEALTDLLAKYEKNKEEKKEFEKWKATKN